VHSRKFFRTWKRGQTEFPKFLEVDILRNVGGNWSEVGGAGIVVVGGGCIDGGWQGFFALERVVIVTDDRNCVCTHSAKAKPEGSDNVRNCRCRSREHDMETSHA
jgi:hypothetical protein